MTRLVVKLGSSSIASGDGLALDVIAGLVTQIAAAQRDGHQVILVTSGAARLGRRLPELAPALRRYETARRDGPLGVALAASAGQPALMALYRQLAAAVGIQVCQVLLSKSDLDSARAMRDVGVVLVSALEAGLLPVVNGNDTTDPKSELDNDQIAVAVAVAAEASRLTFLTNVSGVYASGGVGGVGSPGQHSGGVGGVVPPGQHRAGGFGGVVPPGQHSGGAGGSDRIARLTPEEARAVRSSSPGEGRGGMRSKLNAAARAAYCGIECAIGSARDVDVVARSLRPRGRVGTAVRAQAGQLAPAQRWVGGIAYPMGTIGINREAERSLRAGSTLFLSGVKRVDGDFEPGAVVELVDVRHPERLIGRGSVALPSPVLRLLRALSPDEVADVVSILLRLRHGNGDNGDLLDDRRFADVADLGGRNSQAARQARAELESATPERVRSLADALLASQPRACAAMLASGSFKLGEIAGRQQVRDMHAIHRDSLVVFAT